MEGHFSTGQNTQWAVVPMEEEEEENKKKKHRSEICILILSSKFFFVFQVPGFPRLTLTKIV